MAGKLRSIWTKYKADIEKELGPAWVKATFKKDLGPQLDALEADLAMLDKQGDTLYKLAEQLEKIDATIKVDYKRVDELALQYGTALAKKSVAAKQDPFPANGISTAFVKLIAKNTSGTAQAAKKGGSAIFLPPKLRT